MLLNTLGISFLNLTIGFVVPIVFALLLSELPSRRYKSLVQTVSYLPHFISWVILGGILISWCGEKNEVDHAAAIRFPIGTRRAEPEEMSRFTEATDAYFGSDPLILSFPEQAPQLVLAGKLSGKMEEFRAFLRSRQIDGCAIGYSDAQQSPDTCAEGIAKAKQALKIACLNPAGNFFLYKQGGNYSENGKLLAAMQYIHDHPDEDIGMAQVANSVSLNCNYFSSMFKSQLGVNFILLILQNAEDSRFPPDTHPARRRNVSILQKAFDFPQTVSIQIALRDLANDLCLLGDNLRFSVRSLPVSQKPVIPKYKPSLPVTHSDSLRDVSADGFALSLRERAQAGQNHLAVHVGGIDVFLFKDDSNPQLFSILTYRMQSSVFRANREMDLVRIMSIFRRLHSAIISLNCALFRVLTPEIPSSAKIPASSHSGLPQIFCV